jgi:hypothetical protein
VNPQLPGTCLNCGGTGRQVTDYPGRGVTEDKLCPSCHGTGKAPVCPTCDGSGRRNVRRVNSGFNWDNCPDEFHKAAEALNPQTPGTCLTCGAMNHMTADHTPEATLAERIQNAITADIEAGLSEWNYVEALIRTESQRAVEAQIIEHNRHSEGYCSGCMKLLEKDHD